MSPSRHCLPLAAQGRQPPIEIFRKRINESHFKANADGRPPAMPLLWVLGDRLRRGLAAPENSWPANFALCRGGPAQANPNRRLALSEISARAIVDFITPDRQATGAQSPHAWRLLCRID